jgi:hypothetical protein
MPRFEALAGLPASGPMPLPFGAGGWAGGWGGHREGFVVRFAPEGSEPWVGNFQPGTGGWEGVLEHPDGQHVIVVARGKAYTVEPVQRTASTFSGEIQDVFALPEFGALVFSDGLRFEAIKKHGIWWQSSRISWDEIRNVEIKGAVLRGEASVPTAHGNEWAPFTLDLLTGRCDDGIYQLQMGRAISMET